MGFLRQEYWSGLPFPPPVDHVLSELFTVTHLSWVTLHGMAHSFIELDKPLRQDKAVIHEGRCHHTPIQMSKIKRLTIPSAWENVELLELSHAAAGEM